MGVRGRPKGHLCSLGHHVGATWLKVRLKVMEKRKLLLWTYSFKKNLLKFFFSFLKTFKKILSVKPKSPSPPVQLAIMCTCAGCEYLISRKTQKCDQPAVVQPILTPTISTHVYSAPCVHLSLIQDARQVKTDYL